ncbi:hypothetical protein FB639_004220, partial [Coemansia asiatica]
ILRRPEWDELTESTKIIEKLGHGDSIHYVKAKAIWPTAARDSVLISHITALDISDASGKATQAFLNVSQSIVDERMPERDSEGIVRMEAGIAGQLITRATDVDRMQNGLQGEHWCKVVQIADGDLKGWIPKSVIKFIATQALPRSLTKVCKQLSELPPSPDSQPVTRMSNISSRKGKRPMLQIKADTSLASTAVVANKLPLSEMRRGRWLVWIKIILKYAGPSIIAASITMQFFLDENTVPIRLFAANSAPSLRRRQVPHRQQQEHQFRFQLPSHHHQQQRSVPGYPYIRFVEDDDLDGGYPFDAFQDLRSAYFSSPLSDIQARMRNIQQQRAQAQLHRSLLEQQLREHERRERELIEYQQRLENERRAHAKAAADRARAAYLSRLEKDEQQRQLDALCAARLAASQKASAQRAELPVNNRDENEGEDDEQAVFYPPFHFFNHILSNQIKSQDDIERKRAERNALNSLLETYFGQSADGSEQKKKDNSQSAAASRESSAGANSAGKSRQASQSPFASNVSQQPAPLMASATADTADNSNPSLAAATRHLPPFGIRSSQLDPGVLDNVLRVVHDRLAEIAADEADEKQQQSASASASPA